MAVTFDAASSVSAPSSSTPSWTHTVGVDANALYVFIGGWDGTDRTATATYGGSAMTEIANTGLSNGNDRGWLFRQLAPLPGTDSVAVTISGGSMHVIAGAISVVNAHQTDFSTPVTGVSSVNGTEASVSVTGTDGGLIIDGLISGANNTHLVNGPASHTERWDLALGAQGEAGAGGHSDGTSGAQTIGWTISNSASWVQAAVNIKDAGGAAAAMKRLWRMGMLGTN